MKTGSDDDTFERLFRFIAHCRSSFSLCPTALMTRFTFARPDTDL